MRRQQVNREDRGATAITIAISMLVLMGFTAITIDGGLAYGDRRVLASAADTGALAALQFARPSLIGVGSACGAGSLTEQAACRGAEEAIEVVNGTLPGRFDPVVNDDWATCTDPNRPTEFDANVSPLSLCISFTENFSKSRVKMPDTDLPTTFGRLIGFNSIATGAAAEVELVSIASADILPNSPTGRNQSELCLFSPPGPQALPPCDGFLTGFAGYVDIALHGSDETPPTCKLGDNQVRIGINTVYGSDHDLFVHEPTDTIVNDHVFCPIDIRPEHINQLVVQQGDPSRGITMGLITGVPGPQIGGQTYTPSDGRIVCQLLPPPGYSTDCATVRGVELDHTGLWEFLKDDSCGDPGPTTHAEMRDCLNILPKTPARFDATIQNHPRFAAVPILFPQDAQNKHRIQRFDAVWIETLYFGCTAQSFCRTVHSPGESLAAGAIDCVDPLLNTTNCGWSNTLSSNFVNGMVAFRLDLITLPTDITNTFPGSLNVRGFFLIK